MSFRTLVVMMVCAALVMCASALNVTVERAPNYSPPASPRVSIFGVFHDGRMSEPAWTSLSPKISKALGHVSCELGYGNRFREADSELASWTDRTVAENGIDDEVLEKVSKYAEGDLVMVLMSYRKIPLSRSQDAGVRVRQQGAAPGGGRRMGRQGMRYVPSQTEDDNVFELSASLYSPKDKKLVAQIDLRYTGEDLDEAMAEFTTKLQTLVPGAKCVGWNWPNPDVGDGGEEPEASSPL